MRRLCLDDIVDREQYRALRPSYRAAIIDYKRSRRVAVGERITLLFEDRETLRFQIHEMIWVERISLPEKIQHELDTYNELMPADRELSATLFIEITDAARIRPELDRLIGVDEHVSLLIGESPAEIAIQARFDPKQLEEDRISAVQYIKFPFDETAVRAFCDRTLHARLRIDHPNYAREVEIPAETRSCLIRDLQGEVASLLPAARGAKPGAEDHIVFCAGGVRAVRPAWPLAPGHLIIEPLSDVGSLLEIEDELLLELMAAVRRAAREVVRAHGACRIHADLGGSEQRIRWHVYAPPS
ncbi:MAG TPA: DUF3501 family protein [Myxococcota bacterium]|nr:DUF3501 family protein [Myxococcota bacterium]